MTNKQRKKFRQETRTNGQRFDVMHSRIHGVESNKTKRRKDKQRARVSGWE